MLTEITHGKWVDPAKVAAVVAIDDESCSVFLDGASILDGGIKIDYPGEEVAQQINDAEVELYGQGESEEEEDDED